jgi:hypothetical protein
MQILTLYFNSPLNASLQVGDAVYYHPSTTLGVSGSFSTANINSVVALGVVKALINPLSTSPNVQVNYDQTGSVPQPTINDYIMFGKDKRVNSSGLIGYYAEVTFSNNSTEKAELFSIGSEVSESSK